MKSTKKIYENVENSLILENIKNWFWIKSVKIREIKKILIKKFWKNKKIARIQEIKKSNEYHESKESKKLYKLKKSENLRNIKNARRITRHGASKKLKNQ